MDKNLQILKRLVIIIFIVGFLIRIPGFFVSPLSFHPTRQYRSALIARKIFFLLCPQKAQKWQIEFLKRHSPPLLEPPIYESIVALTYKIYGKENLLFPKIFSTLAWIVSAIFIFFIQRELNSIYAGIFSLLYFLFIPFGIKASRSFQPDLFMILFFTVYCWYLIKNRNSFNFKNITLLGLLGLLSALFKPITLFFIATTSLIAFLSYNKTPVKNRIFKLIIFSLICFSPVFLYYIYGIIKFNSLQNQADMSFVPDLYFQAKYYLGWIRKIDVACSTPAFLLAFLALFLLKKEKDNEQKLFFRRFYYSLWVGYLAYGLIFNYHIHTHDYYQLPFIIIISLGVGYTMESIMKYMKKSYKISEVHFVIMTFIFMLIIPFTDRKVIWFSQDKYNTRIAIMKEIGEIVEHSDRCILSTYGWGKPIEYYGYTTGLILSKTILAKNDDEIIKDFERMKDRINAEYFIINNIKYLKILKREKKLFWKYLKVNYPVFKEGEGYIIFKLS